MAEVGELVRRGDRWVTLSPSRCANGDPLGPNEVLVGTATCDCGVRHQTWFCRACGHVTYGPSLTDGCRVRTGPDER
ncbi:hypothetical protein AWB94_28505 [Mycolicibacterium canariasense]|nr:hypothetical protein AWB94_28505 [Mycolicibacterium canariasense]